MITITLKAKKEESLRRFHPWVFSGAIDRMDGQPEEGDLVRIVSKSGEFLAVGQYQIGSIAVRIFSFDEEPIDDDFLRRRLQVAFELRQTLGLIRGDENNAYRLVHGEGDHLPGLVIDVYAHTAVMQAHTPGMHRLRRRLAEALIQVAGADIRHVYYKSETTLPFKADLDPENGYLIGGEGNTDIAVENGLKFHVDWLKGQKTGFFVDQRDNRSCVEHYARGRNVLNMFCYTGGFSFYAMRGGANLVHSVDSSAQAIELTRRNVELNFPGDTRHEAICEEAFKYLDRAGDQYDLIILDPPAFAKHRKVLHNALQGYRRLNAKAFEKIRPGGILFTFSCSQVVTKEDFRCAVFSAAAQSGRRVRILHQLHQPADHPINIYHPEGEYLKGLVLYVE
jgi:23S rRNA (cytosine1962-C5)-methyltransferase